VLIVLNIIIEFDEVKDKLVGPGLYFEDVYEQDWLDSDLAKEMIKDIDKSEYIGGECIKSPVLGMIPPSMLSGGCKGCLLLLNEPEHLVCGDSFGDNCFPWLSKIGEKHDITVTLHHFFRSEELPVVARIVNDCRVVHSLGEVNSAIIQLGVDRL